MQAPGGHGHPLHSTCDTSHSVALYSHPDYVKLLLSTPTHSRACSGGCHLHMCWLTVMATAAPDVLCSLITTHASLAASKTLCAPTLIRHEARGTGAEGQRGRGLGGHACMHACTCGLLGWLIWLTRKTACRECICHSKCAEMASEHTNQAYTQAATALKTQAYTRMPATATRPRPCCSSLIDILPPQFVSISHVWQGAYRRTLQVGYMSTELLPSLPLCPCARAGPRGPGCGGAGVLVNKG